MFETFRIRGFTPYIIVLLLNAVTDLGHKIVIQNAVFKCFSGTEQIALTAVVNALILLPFLLLFTPSGFISDRFPKDKVIKYSAAASIPMAALILLFYHLGMFWPAFAMTFLLAAQSAIYSPAKYGYIKELVGKEKLAEANAIVQAGTVIAILAGTLAYSLLFESFLSGGETTTGDILLSIAPCGYLLLGGTILETITAWQLPKTSEGDATLRLDLTEYRRGIYLRENLKLLRASEVIWLSIVGLSIFWAVNQVLLAAFGAHLKDAAGVTNTALANGLLALAGVGLIFGSVVAGRVSRNYIETGLIPVAAVGMSITLFLMPNLSNLHLLGTLLFLYGVFGGMLVVPLNALVQFCARCEDAGRVLAGNNFLQTAAMLLFLGVTVVGALFNVGSIPIFRLLGFVIVGGTLYSLYKLPQPLLRYILRILVSQHYYLNVYGLNNIPSQGGVMLLGNHTSYLDWAVLYLASPRPVRFVMDRTIYERWYLKGLLKLFRVIPISPRGARNAIEAVADSLNHGEVVAIFPEGALSRNGQLGEFKRGFQEAAKAADCLIVPFYMHGLWGSTFSFASKRYREMSRPRGKSRHVTICFGEALPRESTAPEVKKQVFRLSMDAWQKYAASFEPVHVSWLRAVFRDPNAPAVIDAQGQKLSGRKLLAVCMDVAEIFEELTKDQQNVGVILPPTSAGVIANLSLLMRGRTVCNLNYTAGAAVVKACMDRANIKTIIASEKFLAKLKGRGFDLTEALEGRRLFLMEDLKEKLSKRHIALNMLKTALYPVFLLKMLHFRHTSMQDTAAILFSSGSEGTPKGVMLSHENMVGNIRQVSCLMNPQDDEVFLGSLPLFHAFGLTVTTLLPLLENIPVVCQPDPTDATAVGKAVALHEVTFVCGTPTFLGIYARNKNLNPLMFKSVRYVIAGAERLSPEVREAFHKKFGLEIHEGYGTTETTPAASINVNDVLITSDFSIQRGHKPGTVGLPVPGSAFRIVDPGTLEDLPQGEAGLILIGGTQIMKGYLDDEERTRTAIVEKDGIRWYKSGDKGVLDEDGFLTILDRYSRFAKIGGEMISLGAVEAALRKVLPETADAVAVTLPDPKKGEKVVALVQGEVDPDAVRKSLLEGNPAILVPSKIVAVPAVPKLGSGKNDLAGAKRLALEMLAGNDAEEA